MLDLLSAAAGAQSAPGWISFLPLIGMVAIFWFLLIRPQMRRQKEHQTKIAAIKKGDQVVTAGGGLGKEVKIDDHYADVEKAQRGLVNAVKATIGDIVAPGGGGAAND